MDSRTKFHVAQLVVILLIDNSGTTEVLGMTPEWMDGVAAGP